MIKINIDIFRGNLVEYALTFLNKKYTWGAKGPAEFDSAGFTWYVYKILFDVDINNGYGLDDTTKQMTSDIGILVKYVGDIQEKKKYIDNIKIGDLLFFHTKDLEATGTLANNKYPGHVGIYIGDNRFIHASSDREMVVISEIDDNLLKIMVASKDIISDIFKRT